MSWKDLLANTPFTITTGDGSVFTPLWKGCETEKEFNASIYDFIKLPGALVDRKEVKARAFPLQFWFVGADNISQSAKFDTAANDSRAWVVTIPWYGSISGHPVKIKRGNSEYNITEFNVDFWETMTSKPPLQQVSLVDQVSGTMNTLATISPINYASKVKLKPADASAIAGQAVTIDLDITKLIDANTYSEYQTLRNAMFASVDTILTAPITALSGIYTVIQQVGMFPIALQNRLDLLKILYADAKDLLGLNPTPNNKAYFEGVGGICVATMATSMVNPIDGDFVIRTQIESASSTLSDQYNDYLTTLDGAYVPLIDPVNNFSPSTETQSTLQTGIIQTLSGLLALAFDAKVERSVVLDRDSNLILLTHKYMGLDVDDVNIETFRQINNIKNKRLFGVRKGTTITYYA